MNEPKVALMELFYGDGTQFVPSDVEQRVVNDVVFLFRQTQTNRDRNFQYFDGLNLIEYIDDSVRRFNTNIDEREGIEDWQAGVHDPFTRNKALGMLGRVLELLPIASFLGRGDEDHQKGIILTDIYLFTEELDDYEELMTHILLEAIVKGTAIGYEDIEYEERTIRDVEGIGDEMTVTEKNLKTTKFIGQIVPLEEFYPSSVSIRKIKDMPFAFWRKVIPYSSFIKSFGHYRKSQVVQEKRSFGETEQRPYYNDFIDANIPDGSVELIRYYDRLRDEYIILANGVWLNPLKGEVIMPLPWNHKELPFWEVKYDIFGDFFYGKSLPDRLKAMQDVLNVLTNMLLDQSFLSIFPPLLTAGTDPIEDDYMRPGRRTPVDTQGMSLDSQFKILEMPTPSGWHQFILEYTRKVMEESSMDAVSQGISGQGDRTTAYEIRTAASGVAAMLQLFARFINMGVKRKAFLRAPNILQYGNNPDAPIVRGILTDDAAEQMEAFQSFTIRNTALTGGRRGTRIIEMYQDKASIPPRDTLRARAELAKVDSGTETEITAVTPEYLRNYLFDVKLVTNPKSEASAEIEQAIQLKKVEIYMNYFPDMVNRQELASETAEKLGDDPTKVFSEQAMMPPQAQEQQGVGLNDQNTDNMVRSAAGGGDQMAQMQQLQSIMTQ